MNKNLLKAIKGTPLEKGMRENPLIYFLLENARLAKDELHHDFEWLRKDYDLDDFEVYANPEQVLGFEKRFHDETGTLYVYLPESKLDGYYDLFILEYYDEEAVSFEFAFSLGNQLYTALLNPFRLFKLLQEQSTEIKFSKKIYTSGDGEDGYEYCIYYRLVVHNGADWPAIYQEALTALETMYKSARKILQKEAQEMLMNHDEV